MTPNEVMIVGQEALRVTGLIAAPMLLTALGVGLLIGMIQAATQIQEMTLSFIPKLLAIGLSMVIAGRWMLHLLILFTERLFESIPSLVG
jgi:flagellar biosynthetic protein FliQ